MALVRVLTEQEFNAVREHVIRDAPEGLSEQAFNELLDREIGKAEQRAPSHSGFLDQFIDPESHGRRKDVPGAAVGFAKGIPSTLAGTGRLIEDLTGVDLPDLPKWIDTEARTPAERVGKFVEQAYEYSIPASGTAKLVGKASAVVNAARAGKTLVPALAHATAQGVTAGAVGAAQEGEVEGGIVPGVVAGALPLVSPIARGASRVFAEKALKQGKGYQQALDELAGGYQRMGLADMEAKLRKGWQQELDDLVGVRSRAATRRRAELKKWLSEEIPDERFAEVAKNPSGEAVRLARTELADAVAVPDLGRWVRGGPGHHLSPTVTPEQFFDQQDVVNKILSYRTPPPINLTELGVVGGVPGYFIDPTVGGVIAAGRFATERFPVQTARALGRLARLSSYPGAGGVAALRTANAPSPSTGMAVPPRSGITDSEPQSPVNQTSEGDPSPLQQELLKRQISQAPDAQPDVLGIPDPELVKRYGTIGLPTATRPMPALDAPGRLMQLITAIGDPENALTGVGGVEQAILKSGPNVSKLIAGFFRSVAAGEMAPKRAWQSIKMLTSKNLDESTSQILDALEEFPPIHRSNLRTIFHRSDIALPTPVDRLPKSSRTGITPPLQAIATTRKAKEIAEIRIKNMLDRRADLFGSRQLPESIPKGTPLVLTTAEFKELYKRYGAPNAVDIGEGLFSGNTASAFFDEKGKIVAFAWPDVYPAYSSGGGRWSRRANIAPKGAK